jgi:tryptophan-rich sensory protein
MKNNFWGKLITLLIVNFGALALGAAWTDPGTNSDWYRLANQAPWSPPGWVFGAAWFTIGVTYSIMVAFIETSTYRNLDQIYRWFWLSVLLNVAWNPVFFMFHAVWTGVGVLLALAACIYYLVDFARQALGWKVAWLGMPYFLWLMIATSLNMYIAIMN